MLRRVHTIIYASMSVLTGDNSEYQKLRSRISEPSLAQCLSARAERCDVIKREQHGPRDSITWNKTNMVDQVVMVTGGAGFLGQHVVKLLQEKADNVKEIRVFDIKPYENKLGHAEPKKVVSVTGDIRRLSEVSAAARGVDAVIHTAGLVSFGTFPDHDGMEEINVKGTKNVIQACIERGVQRLVYTSTIDVVVGYDDIYNGDESLPIPKVFLFPGYPDTKYRAERAVLAANGSKLANGSSAMLRTVALRPNVMYGEGDPFYVTSAIKAASQNKGVMPRVGDGSSLFQQAYVGNMAWGHLKANEALSRDDTVGGKVFFLTDDTPLMNSFSFMETFLKPRGLSLSTYSIPYSFVYCMLWATESFLHFISPVYKYNMSTALCSLIYVNKTFYFNRAKAEQMLEYSPLYDFTEAAANSMPYYEKWSPNQTTK